MSLKQPGVSIIIPAHNAEGTVEATLNSVLLQTYTVWEAVIIDDGSTDNTNRIAQDWARRDGRFRSLRQKKSGVSAARNTGLREARYPFVLFLDSDDVIDRTHLERMAHMLAADRALDAVHCGWQRSLPSGLLGPPRMGPDYADLFEYFAFQCVFPIHTCVLRRDLALAVGGFDTSLTTCEDWDFFQRVARTGARFGRVPKVLAFYQVRVNSASQDSQRCLADARVVLDRGHGQDPRMQNAAQVHVEGRDPAYRNLALYYTITYLAAQEIGEGRDGLDLLDGNDFASERNLLPGTIGDVIHEYFAFDRLVEDWPGLWSQINTPLVAFLARLETKTGVPALAFATLRHLEKKMLLADLQDGPLLVGSTYRVNVDLARRIPDVFLPPKADRLICRLTLKGEPIGAVELPGTGVLTGRRIAKAAAGGRRRLLLCNALTSGQGFYVGFAMVRSLLQRRTLHLLWDILAAKPKDRLSTARRVAHEVGDVVGANLSRVLATRPGLAATRAVRRWQKYLEAVAASGRAQAREQIALQSRSKRDRPSALPDHMGRKPPFAEAPVRPQDRRRIWLVRECSWSVPILMYHRIAFDGPAALELFRLTPDLFASQVAALHGAGYRTIGLGDWVSAMARRSPLPDKPVILTFDDGYRDFLRTAMPILRTHCFSATIFLVAERIGGTADWDGGCGEPAPLLSWEEVRTLQETGIEFGCHSSLHRPLTGMHLQELAEDTVRARAILEAGLATCIKTLAYPYGAENEFVRRAVEDLGFESAVTCQPGISRPGDNPLRLPRIEVPGGCSPKRLFDLIDHASQTAML